MYIPQGLGPASLVEGFSNHDHETWNGMEPRKFCSDTDGREMPLDIRITDGHLTRPLHSLELQALNLLDQHHTLAEYLAIC